MYNILIFFAEKMWVAFALQKLLTFFQKKFQHICVSLDVTFNESLTNDIVSFEQMGPDILKRYATVWCTSDWWSGLDPHWVFHGDWSRNIFCGHSLFHWFKKGICQFLVTECAQVLVNCLEENISCGYSLEAPRWGVHVADNQTVFRAYVFCYILSCSL